MSWVVANANLALVKYWGKLASGLPATSSLSVTLAGLETAVQARPLGVKDPDRALGLPPAVADRIARFLRMARGELGVASPLEVEIHSSFPVAAGLASSASIFAALTVAVARHGADPRAPSLLGDLARRGSGSACRSIHGGFVEWREGERDASPVAPATHWPLRVLAAITTREPKAVSTSEAMARTRDTSPYHPSWIEAARSDFAQGRRALIERDLEALGPVMERNCLRMHAAILGAAPPILYWKPATLAVMDAVRDLRASGTSAWFTIDAGPQVKVLCSAEAAEVVKSALRSVPGVLDVLDCAPGGPPRAMDRAPEWLEARRAA